MIASGSVSTFCSKITLPASSTTHTDVSFTDTSRPTKCEKGGDRLNAPQRARCADSEPSRRHSQTGRFDHKQTHRRKVIRATLFQSDHLSSQIVAKSWLR